jgi:hypothetical protein
MAMFQQHGKGLRRGTTVVAERCDDRRPPARRPAQPARCRSAQSAAREGNPEALATVLRHEMQSAESPAPWRWALAGRRRRPSASRPRAHRRTRPGLHAIGVADPTRTDPNFLRRADAVLPAGASRPQGVPGVSPLPARPSRLPPLVRAGRAAQRSRGLPHRRHLLALAKVRLSRIHWASTKWRSIIRRCAS